MTTARRHGKIITIIIITILTIIIITIRGGMGKCRVLLTKIRPAVSSVFVVQCGRGVGREQQKG